MKAVVPGEGVLTPDGPGEVAEVERATVYVRIGDERDVLRPYRMRQLEPRHCGYGHLTMACCRPPRHSGPHAFKLNEDT